MKKSFIILFIAAFLLSGKLYSQQVARATDVQLVTTSGTKLVFSGGITFKGTSNFIDKGETYLYKTTAPSGEGWLDSTAAGVLDATSTGNVFFKGSFLQSFYGKTKFYDLSIRNTAGDTILSSCEVKNLLHLDTGFVFTATGYGNDSLLVSNPATTAISSTSSYTKSWVNGRLSRAGNATAPSYLFPIGKTDSLYAPIKMDKQNTSTAIWTAEYFAAQPYDYLNIFYPPIDHISRVEYWEITSNQSGGTNDYVTLSLSWRGHSQVSADPTKRDSLLVVQYINRPPFIWDAPGSWVTGKAIGPDSLSGYVTRNSIGGFNYLERRFTLGTFSKYNALPLKLVYFTAAADANKVRLNWDVTNEQDVRYYEVEKSLSAVTFSHLSTVNSLQQSQSLYTDYDQAPAAGWNYYRLKITDKQGNVTYSPVRAVNFNGEESIKIFPNPATSVLNIELPTGYINTATLRIYAADGKYISALKPASNIIKLNVLPLPSGTYAIVVTGPDGIARTYRFVKQ